MRTLNRDRLKAMLRHGLRPCTLCFQILPLSDFGVQSNGAAGHSSTCRPCTNARARRYTDKQKAVDPERFRVAMRASRDAYLVRNPPSPEYIRQGNLRRKYKLTPERFDELLAAQGGGCAICGTATPGGINSRFHVDHDHACCSGYRSCGACVRGLLCTNCNRGLGHFKDEVEQLQSAIRYLDKYRRRRLSVVA